MAQVRMLVMAIRLVTAPSMLAKVAAHAGCAATIM
jgi:hypothetical protein